MKYITNNFDRINNRNFANYIRFYQQKMLTIDIKDYSRDFDLLLIIDIEVKATRRARIIIELLFIEDIEYKQSTIKNRLEKLIILISKFKSKLKSKDNTTFLYLKSSRILY